MNTMAMLKPYVSEKYKEDLGGADLMTDEYSAFASIARLIRPCTILEIGVYMGYSAIAMIDAYPGIVGYTGLDAQAYRNDSNEFAQKSITAYCRDKGLKMGVEILSGNTQDDEWRRQFDGRKYDLVHIDGGHSTHEALNDILHFWPNTMIAMAIHDFGAIAGVRQAVLQVVEHHLVDFRYTLHVASKNGIMVLIR